MPGTGSRGIGPNDLFSFVSAIILLFLPIGIVIGAGKLFLQLGTLFAGGKITRIYLQIISDVLSLFILVELSRSLVDYFEARRLRMTFIVDARIVIVRRKIMIELFQHESTPAEIYALSALLFLLGALRTASALVFQRDLAVKSRARSERS